MRAAVIKDNRVINIILVDDLSFDCGEGNILVASETANIEDIYDGKSFSPPPPIVPDRIDRRQFKLALLEIDVLARVTEAINSITDYKQRSMVEIEWSDTGPVGRYDIWVKLLLDALGIVQQSEVDNLFVMAARI